MRTSLSCILTSSYGINAQKDDVKLQEIIQFVRIGDRIDYAIYENRSFWSGYIVPSSLQFRKNFEDEIYFKGGVGRIVTLQNIP